MNQSDLYKFKAINLSEPFTYTHRQKRQLILATGGNGGIDG